MAKLYIKGILKPIIISSSQAKNLGAIYDDEKIGGESKYNIGGTRFAKKDIKNIIEEDAEDNTQEHKDKQKEENTKYYEEVTREYNKHIVRLCDKSPEEKALDTKLYELTWSNYTTESMTLSFVEEVRRRQLIFFLAHPRYPYASINISDLLPRQKAKEDSIAEVMPQYITTKLQNIISEAYNTAKLLHKI